MSDLAPLKEQLLLAASQFAEGEDGLRALLRGIADDVERAMREPLEIVPVAHHSPASAIHLLQRLRARAPKVIFLELCEDLGAKLSDLADCKLPIALQAFATEIDGFPPRWAPLSVVAPLTEMSAEYQAIAYALTHPETELVLVDRSVDHVFAWRDDPDDHPAASDDDDESARLHGGAIGIEVGSLVPSFEAFREALCANAKVAHFQEWWSLYVEQPTIAADYATYRQVYCLVGSLIRRLGVRRHLLEIDRRRERFMWTRIKEHLARAEIAPEDALYVCGAAHAASDVPEFGTQNDLRWDIPPRTATQWLYGFIPSSHAAIEHQFGHPVGTITLAERTWSKALKSLSLTPFRAGKREPKKVKAAKPIEGPSALDVIARPVAFAHEDHEQLLAWCTGIVELARKNDYLATTADSIAIYETVTLLARLRGRIAPSAYDFTDAAITCLEKSSAPGKRDVRRLCEILLGGDRIGQVGYASLPPLVQNVYDRLAPAGVKAGQTTITRWLARLDEQPQLAPCSDLLWRIAWMFPGTKLARPILGERALGKRSTHESWDIKLGGAEQRLLIELAYEGVTIEQVLERRLRERAFGPESTTARALDAAEQSILLLGTERLTADLGERAIALLVGERGSASTRAIFEGARRLVHYYRGTPAGLPGWLERFVQTGYTHYATQLPDAFADRGTTPEALSAVLAFVFTLEGLALALGCDRSQLTIAVEQAAALTDDPNKLGLLWVAEWLLDRRSEAALRAEFAHVLAQPMLRRVFPAYVGGLMLALELSPRVASVAVELVTRAFAELPDHVLFPWLPGLFQTLASRRALLGALFSEVARAAPPSLDALDAWIPPWRTAPEAVEAPEALGEDEAACRSLLDDHRASLEAHAAALGVEGGWAEGAAALGVEGGSVEGAAARDPEAEATRALVIAYPAALEALAPR